jgi:hypothetical protein
VAPAWEGLIAFTYFFQGFKAFLDDMLYSLARKIRLPDSEFLLNLGDWPQIQRIDEDGVAVPPVPVFAWYASWPVGYSDKRSFLAYS